MDSPHDVRGDVARPGPGGPVGVVGWLLPAAVDHAPSPSCAPGSPRPRCPAGSSWRPTRWATRWRGGVLPGRLPVLAGVVPDERTPGSAAEGSDRHGLPRQAILTGSHLDSVLDGGAYDGPLGVVSALAAVDVMRERGVVPSRPIGVSVFTEEEGSRFGLACLGSRLGDRYATWADARERRDRDGVCAARRAGHRRARRRVAGGRRRTGRPLDEVGCFVELHVEQGRDLVDRDVAVGVASEIWPHGRYRFDFTGRGQPRRHDPDGGPPRPDADLRHDRAGRQQAGPPGRAAGHLRSARGRPQRHQRRAVAGHRLARRAVLVRRGARRPGRRDLAARARSARSATAPGWS